MTLLLHNLQFCKPSALIRRTPLLLRVIGWRLLGPCLARIVDYAAASCACTRIDLPVHAVFEALSVRVRTLNPLVISSVTLIEDVSTYFFVILGLLIGIV